MNFDDYQKEIIPLRQYPNAGANIVYPALGLVGEAGEVAEKVKKLWRNNLQTNGKDIHAEDRLTLIKELGDVLWYIAAMADELGVSLSTIAGINITKLKDRNARGVIKSEGDNR